MLATIALSIFQTILDDFEVLDIKVALSEYTQSHRQNDNEPGDYLLPEKADTSQDQSIGDDRQDDSAYH